MAAIRRRFWQNQWIMLLPVICFISTFWLMYNSNKNCAEGKQSDQERLETFESTIQAIKRQKEILLSSLASKERELRKVKFELLKQKWAQDEQHQRSIDDHKANKSSITIYVVTPTYARLTQKADLIRLSQTLQHVNNIHWIVIEDANATSKLVTNIMKRSKLAYTQLSIRTPAFLLRQRKEPKWKKPRGVAQRNRALLWLREHKQQKKSQGVVYFADDDNTYDKELFDKFRNTKRVSVWPVGLVGGLRFEGPRCSYGKITGWRVVFDPNRPFPFDMAGFAVNLDLILENYKAHFSASVAPGYLESSLLSSLVKNKNELETITDDCTTIMVWHTTTPRVALNREPFVKAIPGLDDNKVEV